MKSWNGNLVCVHRLKTAHLWRQYRSAVCRDLRWYIMMDWGCCLMCPEGLVCEYWCAYMSCQEPSAECVDCSLISVLLWVPSGLPQGSGITGVFSCKYLICLSFILLWTAFVSGIKLDFFNIYHWETSEPTASIWHTTDPRPSAFDINCVFPQSSIPSKWTCWLEPY